MRIFKSYDSFIGNFLEEDACDAVARFTNGYKGVI